MLTCCSGMRTVYISRWTEDQKEDMEQARAENDYFIDGMDEAGQGGGGLIALARQLGIEIPGIS